MSRRAALTGALAIVVFMGIIVAAVLELVGRNSQLQTVTLWNEGEIQHQWENVRRGSVSHRHGTIRFENTDGARVSASGVITVKPMEDVE